jgi:hypothetical protein
MPRLNLGQHVVEQIARVLAVHKEIILELLEIFVRTRL